MILLRHTHPDVAPGTCYGRTDLDVSDSFDSEAARIIAELPAFELLVSSPAKRCRALAEFIAARRNLKVNIDDRVQEMNFGSWEGVPWSKIPRNEIDAWAQSFMEARPHGGESVSMVHRRTRDAMDYYRRLDLTTVIVTHAGFIKAALASGDTVSDFDTAVDFGCFIEVTEGHQNKPLDQRHDRP